MRLRPNCQRCERWLQRLGYVPLLILKRFEEYPLTQCYIHRTSSNPPFRHWLMPSAPNFRQLSSVSWNSTLCPSLTTFRKSGVKCSGEVQVLKVEGDFAQWGIKILVSYRDIDRLKMLTGTHQSGGVSILHYVILCDIKHYVNYLSSRNAHLPLSLISWACQRCLEHPSRSSMKLTKCVWYFSRNWSFTLSLTITLGYGSACRAGGAQSACRGYMRCPRWTVGYTPWTLSQ